MNQSDSPEWRNDGVPVSPRFDDPYFSLENGLDETRHTFIAGNRLPDRFRDGFHIAELGFGTGLNLLATLFEWRRSGSPGVLCFTTFEAYPMAADDMIRAQSRFSELHEISQELEPFWREGAQEIALPDLHFRMVPGDARVTVPRWYSMADAWYLDGFSPAKNPEMWGARLLDDVARHTNPGGTAATYTAAGHVRRALQEAGFHVERVAGYSNKRHMTVAHLP